MLERHLQLALNMPFHNLLFRFIPPTWLKKFLLLSPFHGNFANHWGSLFAVGRWARCFVIFGSDSWSSTLLSWLVRDYGIISAAVGWFNDLLNKGMPYLQVCPKTVPATACQVNSMASNKTLFPFMYILSTLLFSLSRWEQQNYVYNDSL